MYYLICFIENTLIVILESHGVMIGCSAEENCPIEWYHLNCVDLYKMPEGDFYCNECVESGRQEEDDGAQYCICYRSANFDHIIKCRNRTCEIVNYHKCCISEQLDNYDDWVCEECL